MLDRLKGWASRAAAIDGDWTLELTLPGIKITCRKGDKTCSRIASWDEIDFLRDPIDPVVLYMKNIIKEIGED